MGLNRTCCIACQQLELFLSLWSQCFFMRFPTAPYCYYLIIYKRSEGVWKVVRESASDLNVNNWNILVIGYRKALAYKIEKS